MTTLKSNPLAKAGKPWTYTDRDSLKEDVYTLSLAELSLVYERTEGGILAKLVSLKILQGGYQGHQTVWRDTGKPYNRKVPINPAFNNPIKKEVPMSTTNVDVKQCSAKQPVVPYLVIETIYGRDITTMSEDELIAALRQLEHDLKRLNELEQQPKAITRRIDRLKKAIARVFSLLNK